MSPPPSTPAPTVPSPSGESFAALYDATASRVWGLATAMLDDRGAVEDVFEAVYAEASRTPSAATTRPFAEARVIGIAHRRLVARRRDAPTPLPPSPAPAALGGLTSAQREVLDLAWFGGRTHEQIDTQLGLAPGTAAGRIRSALLRLRDQGGTTR